MKFIPQSYKKEHKYTCRDTKLGRTGQLDKVNQQYLFICRQSAIPIYFVDNNKTEQDDGSNGTLSGPCQYYAIFSLNRWLDILFSPAHI